MKLDAKEMKLLVDFISNADEFSMYDEKNICVLQISRLKNNALSFDGNNKISSFNIQDIHFEFSFENYELSTGTIYFFKKDRYVLKVSNYGNGYDIIPELERLK